MNIRKFFANTLILVSTLVSLFAAGSYDAGLTSFRDIFIYFVAAGLAIYIGAEIHLNEEAREKVTADKEAEREILREIEKERRKKEYERVKAEFYAPGPKMKE